MSNLVICIIIFALSLISYALNKIPMALTALITMAALIFTGCIDASTALGGFANTNTVIIVGMPTIPFTVVWKKEGHLFSAARKFLQEVKNSAGIAGSP